jgi:CYTH domain-containing protein
VATEVERKWVADGVPVGVELGDGTALRQGYVAVDGDVTVRVRIATEEAWLTIKAGGDGLSRTEVEVQLPPEEAEQLWEHTAGRRLTKTRHRVPVGSHVAEVDVFGGALDGLVLVEVEFANETEAADFAAADWFGREVTDVPGWSNASLATDGLPEDR